MNSRTRAVVLPGLVALLVATAGCGMLGGGSQSNMLLVNNDNTAHDVSVEILDDGEPMYTADSTVEPGSEVELSSFEQTGEYTVLVTVDGRETKLTHEFTSDDSQVSVGISKQGNVFLA